MNARAYFSILRPVRTLVYGGFYGWCFGVTLLNTIGRAPWPETIFLSIAVLGSWLLGSFLLGPVHELMSRNFFMTLPGARLSIRRWHLRAVGVSAILLFVGTEYSRFAYPRPATLGLILLGLTLPLLNRSEPTPRAFFLKVVFMLGISVLLGSSLRSLMLDACRELPWLVFALGVGGAWFCFRLGFSEESVRERNRFPQVVCCAQSLVPGFGWVEMMRYVQTENARVVLSRRKQRPCREWTVASVGTAFREWLAVVHHARWGASRGPLQLSYFLLLGVMPPVMVTVMAVVLPQYMGQQHETMMESVGQIADAGRVEASLVQRNGFPYVMSSVFGLATAVLACVAIGGTSLRLPVSRSRLAACVSVETLRFGAITFAGYAISVLGMALAAGVIASRPFEFARLGRPFVCIMILPPLAFAVLTILFLTARVRWIPPLVSLGVCLLVGIGAVVVGIHKAAIFYTLPGLISWSLFTGLVTWGCWAALHRYYSTCDLSRPSPWTKSMSTAN
jgi:hypothetical protein